jgi:hypothetical protein
MHSFQYNTEMDMTVSLPLIVTVLAPQLWNVEISGDLLSLHSTKETSAECYAMTLPFIFSVYCLIYLETFISSV